MWDWAQGMKLIQNHIYHDKQDPNHNSHHSWYYKSLPVSYLFIPNICKSNFSRKMQSYKTQTTINHKGSHDIYQR